jgi:hypothetical protein
MTWKLTVKTEAEESEKAYNYSAQDVSIGPWVDLATPRESDQEQHTP